jgi:hypothetical protein
VVQQTKRRSSIYLTDPLKMANLILFVCTLICWDKWSIQVFNSFYTIISLTLSTVSTKFVSIIVHFHSLVRHFLFHQLWNTWHLRHTLREIKASTYVYIYHTTYILHNIFFIRYSQWTLQIRILLSHSDVTAQRNSASCETTKMSTVR